MGESKGETGYIESVPPLHISPSYIYIYINSSFSRLTNFEKERKMEGKAEGKAEGKSEGKADNRVVQRMGRL